MTKEDIDLMQKTFADFKTANEAALQETKKFGTVTAETQTKVDRLSTALDSIEKKITDRIAAEEKVQKAHEEFEGTIKGRLDEIEKLIAKKSPHLSGDQKAAQAEIVRGVFFKALKSGVNPSSIKDVLSADEIKVLQLGSDPAGGYLAPIDYVQEILKDVVQFSPIRSVVTVRPTTRAQVGIPRRVTSASASWTAELGTRSETTNPGFGMETLNTHEMYAMTKISRAELEDSVFDLQAFLKAEFAEQFGVLEGTGFVSGTGIGQPEGFLTHSGVAQTVTGDATHITPDSLIDLYFDLKEQYLPDAYWACSRSTLKVVRKMKDGDGNYLWAPGIKTEGYPTTILDRPYIICPDMPAIGAGTFPVVFGSFRRGMIVVDRLEIEMMMDPFTSKSSGMIEFSARKRVGAQVVIAEALKKLKVST